MDEHGVDLDEAARSARSGRASPSAWVGAARGRDAGAIGQGRYESLQPEYNLYERVGYETELEPLCRAQLLLRVCIPLSAHHGHSAATTARL